MDGSRVQVATDYQARERVLSVLEIDVARIVRVVVLQDVFSVVLHVYVRPHWMTWWEPIESFVGQFTAVGFSEETLCLHIIIPGLINHVGRPLLISVTISHVLNFFDHLKHPAPRRGHLMRHVHP